MSLADITTELLFAPYFARDQLTQARWYLAERRKIQTLAPRSCRNVLLGVCLHSLSCHNGL